MTELYFLRHAQRIDHAVLADPSAQPLHADYKPYDPSLATYAEVQIEHTARDIVASSAAFAPDDGSARRKNVFIHFSPYLRCCQTADLLITKLKAVLEEAHPSYKVRFQLLGDFALSEWIHDKMKNKPPFIDSNDAYHMYTPNVKLLKNKSACSNFRPTNTLGHYNGFDLSYSDYQTNCKEYFKKLLATYDKPAYIKNQDIIIVVSHGYLINNFLSYFINHPIFDEIPEAKINYAAREIDDPKYVPGDDIDLSKYIWRLCKDALGLFKSRDNVDLSLNLETDIVYYKTNFIKKDELTKDDQSVDKKPEDKPRASFKIQATSATNSAQRSTEYQSNLFNNPICPAAKDWAPQKHKAFKVKNEFKLKVMNDEAFRRNYSVTLSPSKPISPEVSPSSQPTGNNSVIDLSKLVESNQNYRPMKLRYSTASEIPMAQLNQKVNSQLNLAQFQRSNPSSNNSSITDFPRFSSSFRKRSTSNPPPSAIAVAQPSKDSYFPMHTSSPKSRYSDNSTEALNDAMEVDSDLEVIREDKGAMKPSSELPPPVPLATVKELTRSKSLNYKKNLALNNGRSILAMYQKSQAANSSEGESTEDDKFTLSFHDNKEKAVHKKQHTSPTTARRNSIKFIPSMLTYERTEGASTPLGVYADADKGPTRPKMNKSHSMFYNLDSDSDSNAEAVASDSETHEFSHDDNDKNVPYMWFGQNRS